MDANLIRVASYNIRKARGLDQKRKPERILQVINGLEADVVVLQEADRRLGQRPTALPRDLITTETDFDLVEVSEDGPGIGWHGNAVLLRNGLRVDSVERLKLPGLEPRGAVRLTLKIGEGLTLVAAHLGLRRRDRRAQLRTLNQTTRHDRHCVIAGDFNEWSHTRGFEPLAGRFEMHSPGRSFHASRPIAALDRFAITSSLTLHDAGVQDGSLAKISSDHLPVWSDIHVPAATC